ncbi:MAG TPA: NAD(P)/FAD-dependent oxidoreductase [Candidatus Dormibacteraeota bacterium]
METHDVVVVGAGQAGLSLSHELTRAGREHLVLERGEVGQSWRERWDSFCLVLPSWTISLPGGRYEGPEPDAFMPRDDFVQHLVTYARSFDAPIREHVTVTALDVDGGGTFRLTTSAGQIAAREVVIASGGYQRPHRPPAVAQLSPFVNVLTITEYSNPGALAPGKVLVLGSGQSGCQIAEELREAGREVWLACGRAPWTPRRLAGHDMMWWLLGSGFMNQTLADLPSPLARLIGNPQASGRGGGHDLHYRTLQALGVTLTGRLRGAEDGRAHFEADLHDSVAFGDGRYREIRERVAATAAAKGIPVPELADPPPFVADPPTAVDLTGFAAAILTAGFRPDYKSWVNLPNAFDDVGFPLQVDGSSTVVPGLHFMGVHFQRKRKSASLMGVGEDAEVLAERLTGVGAKN